MRRPQVIAKSLLWISLIFVLRPAFGIAAFVVLLVTVHLAYRDGRRRQRRDEAMVATMSAKHAGVIDVQVAHDAAA